MLWRMWRDQVRSLSITARDGPKLCAYLCGERGPVMVLASGLGGPYSAWRYQLGHFSKRYRVVS